MTLKIPVVAFDTLHYTHI